MGESILQIQVPNEYSGKQVAITGGRLVFNSNTNDTIIAAKNTIALAASNEIHLNAKGNLYLNVSPGSKIIVGKAGTKDRPTEYPAVLGTPVQALFEDILQLLITFTVTTPSGEGQASPKVNEEIQKLKKKYFTPQSNQFILSDLLYIAANKR